MGTNYIAPTWRMPKNTNKDKLSNYGIDTAGTSVGIDCGPMADLFETASVNYNTSYSIWIKPEFNYNDTTYQTFFGNYTSGATGVLLYYHTGNDVWRFIVGDGTGNNSVSSSTITSNAELGKGEWQHHCVVFDTLNNNAYYYVNGTQVNTSTSLGKDINTTGNFYIGKKWDLTSGTFAGEVSQACIFDYALSTDQIGYLYNLNNPMAISGAEPIAYWPLGDNSNPNAPGSFPNISVGADSVFDFPSITSGDYIDTSYNLDGLTNFTVSAWFNADNTTANAVTIVSTRTGAISASKGLDIYIAASNLYWRVYNNGATQILQSFTNTTDWQHVVLTYDGSILRAYLNGSLVNSATGSYVTSDANMLIGKWNQGPYYFDGQISNVQVWDNALGLSDVEDLYNNGQPLMTGTQPQEANLQAWYKLNQTANYNPGVGPFSIEKVGSPDDGSGNGCFTSGGQLKWIDTNSQLLSENDYFTFLSPLILCNSTDVDLSSTGGSFQSASSQLEYALEYSIDGGSWTTWKTQVVSSGTPVTNWTVSAASNLTCNSSIQVRLRATGGLFGTSQFNWNDLEIKVNNNRVYFETFSTNGLGWTNGSYTAPTDNYIDPVWQIPDNRSAYPQSFSFSGNSDRISLGKGNFQVVTSITTSAWIKTNLSGTRQTIISNDNASSGSNNAGRCWVVLVNGQNIDFTVRPENDPVPAGTTFSNITTSGVNVSDNNWHNVVALWDGTTNPNSQKVFVDGILRAQGTPSFTEPIRQYELGTGPVIGDMALSSAFWSWDGELSNIQLWESALTYGTVSSLGDTAGGQVAQLYNNGVPSTTAIATDNLKAWYKLDNTENFLKPNSSQTQNLYELWLVQNQKYPASVQNCLLFGRNTEIRYDGFYLSNQPEITYSFWWMNENSVNSWDLVVGNRHGTYYNLRVLQNRSSAPTVYAGLKTNDGSGGYNTATVYLGDIITPTVGWSLITFTYDGSTFKAYLNDNEMDSASITGSLWDVSSGGVNGEISIRDGNGSAEGMRMSNLIIWNKGLTGSEVSTLYNNGTPLLTKDSLPQNSSMLLWNTLENKTETTNGGLYDKSGNSVAIKSVTNTANITIDNAPVSAESGISSGMTEQNLVNNNVSVVNGESEGMNSTNLMTSNISRTQPYSNYSFNFDSASADYFDLGGLQGTALQPSDATLLSDGFSVSIWVSLDSIANYGLWQNDGLGQTSYAGLLLQINSTGQINMGYSNNGGGGTSNRLNYITTNNEITSANTWYHVVAIYKGVGNVASPVAQGLYVNGVEVTAFNAPTGNASTLVYSASAKGSIGTVRNAVVPLDGKISNCACFDRTLTQDEVLNIYNNGVPQDLQVTSTFSNNLVAWWAMDEHSSYYDGSDWVIRDIENGIDGNGANTGNVDDIIGNAPGSEASGTGTNLTISDLKGNMKNSKENAYSINMADYADGVTNPANSGRSTNIP